MVEGRVRKITDEVSLVQQPFVKNPEQSVKELLKSKNAQVLRFIRYELGEGIEKKVCDFAKEVMEQVEKTKG